MCGRDRACFGLRNWTKTTMSTARLTTHMKTPRSCGRPVCLLLLCCGFALIAARAQAQPRAGATGKIVLEASVAVDLLTPGSDPQRDWISTKERTELRPGYRVRTGPHGGGTIRWSDNSVVPLGPMTEVEILDPHTGGAVAGLRLWRGIISFFHREKPGRIRVITRGAVAGIRGTEFVVSVDPQTERTTLSVIDGEVGLTNAQGGLALTNDEQAIVDVGQAPQKTPGFLVNNVLQWAFYYPGVLDDRELPLSANEQTALAASLAAYRAGDLIAALTNYPDARPRTSEAGRIFYAALLLSAGRAEESERELNLIAANASARTAPLAGALRQLIAAVKGETLAAPAGERTLASELLAGSYYEQSRALGDESLNRALVLARAATTNSPEFGFAWARVAELEFSFGRTAAALEALNKSLALAPRNAQALALKGFLLAAQNKPRDAMEWFDRALAVDPHLGNAWLGRGLVKIRRGDLPGGRDDLLIAAAIEPRRAALRSYLGKAHAEANEPARALPELERAKAIDPHDPTAWLYSALVKAEHNRINEAIRDLERSQELNDNRSLYRSSLLLDQDRAARSANLARIYRDAGMAEWSILEAGRAVTYDYASYSTHLFLANSYDQLRDPNRVNLRYETAAESEYLIANLLSPAGGGLLSQSVSQQEYSRLFERERLGVSSFTEYLSRGAWREEGAQYGVWRNSSYLVEGLYRSDPGQQSNGDFEDRDLRLHLKQHVTEQDSVYLRVIDREAETGDVRQHYHPRLANWTLHTSEHEPLVQLGYHREWSPGVHTLLLLGRLASDLSVEDERQPTFFIIKRDGVTPSYVQPLTVHQDYRNETELYAAELQQIWQTPSWDTIVGGRIHVGGFDTSNLQTQPAAGDTIGQFPTNGPLASQEVSVDYERFSLYAYEYWRLDPRLQLIGGVAYDYVRFPENFRAAPVSRRTETADQVSPKAGILWHPGEASTIRFSYTRSLSGAGIDQSLVIEPSQVAGFSQNYRSLIPESVAGANAAAASETFGLAAQARTQTRTYFGIVGEVFRSEVPRTIGTFQRTPADDFAVPASTREELDFEERRLVLAIDQLVGDEFVLGVRYRFSDADLRSDFPEIPSAAFISNPSFQPRARLSATTHQVVLQAIWNHPSGFFSKCDVWWTQQDSDGYVPELESDSFWQVNVLAGYRWARRRAEVALGILNLADIDYRLNPLNGYNELPRDRTFIVQVRLSF